MSVSEGSRIWKEFDPSTFTFLGRNDVAVKWVADFRKSHGLSTIKNVWLLGSGSVEPFTIAAIPGLEKATIHAAEMNGDLVGLGNELKEGNAVPWGIIASKSLNPGTPNIDLIENSRLKQSFSILETVGSLPNLGNGINLENFRVPQNVANRVFFHNQDALTFLHQNGLTESPDLIGDFFVQVNINKHPEGLPYSNEVVGRCLDNLSGNGFYLVGDTGRNLPTTLDHFDGATTHGKLNIASLVHAVNFGGGYGTSHYLVASKLTQFPDSEQLIRLARQKMLSPQFSQFSPIEVGVSLKNLSRLTRTRVQLVYVAGNASNGTSWLSNDDRTDVLNRIVPEKLDEFSEDLLIPAQKPYLAHS